MGVFEIIAAIALGVGLGTFIGLCIHIELSSDDCLRDAFKKVSDENVALKLTISEMGEDRRDILDHNAYLAQEASQDRAENERLKKENKRLRELLTTAKTDMMYLLMELEATGESFNAEKLLPALYVLKNEYGLSVEKVDADFATICDYLEGQKCPD